MMGALVAAGANVGLAAGAGKLAGSWQTGAIYGLVSSPMAMAIGHAAERALKKEPIENADIVVAAGSAVSMGYSYISLLSTSGIVARRASRARSGSTQPLNNGTPALLRMGSIPQPKGIPAAVPGAGTGLNVPTEQPSEYIKRLWREEATKWPRQEILI